MNSERSGLEAREDVNDEKLNNSAEQPSHESAETEPVQTGEAAAMSNQPAIEPVSVSATPESATPEVEMETLALPESEEQPSQLLASELPVTEPAQSEEPDAYLEAQDSVDATDMIAEDAPTPAAVADDEMELAVSDEDFPHVGAVDHDDHDDDELEHDARPEEGAEGARRPAREPRPAPTHGLNRGDLVEGLVSRTLPTAVYVDLGNDVEGMIPGRELERMTRQALDELKPGEKVPVFVINPQDHQGRLVLSYNRALEEMDWREAEQYNKSQNVYDGNIAGYNKGGLIVRFGRLRGFVPQSQLADDRRVMMQGETPEQRWGNMINDQIAVKVVEVDRSRNRLILSERAASREVREKRKETLIKDLTVGEVRTGRVVSLEDFGAFVDIGGAEGLVHLTELSWRHVTHPRDLLQVGQPVKVEVISVDRDRKRIGLSMKRQEADPWDEVASTYRQGELVQATVTKLTKFGAFAQLVEAPDIEGLIHISELSDQRVNHPREVVKEGDKLTLRVVKIDIKNRRLGLSLKRVNSAEYLDIDMNRASSRDSGVGDSGVGDSGVGDSDDSSAGSDSSAGDSVSDD